MHPAKATHFAHVARNMNSYVMQLNRQYYAPQYRTSYDRVNHLNMYGGASFMTSGLGGMLAYGLHYMGMPPAIVGYGYRFGYFLDTHA